MFTVNWLSVDVIWFDKLGIVKARHRNEGWPEGVTKWYVWIWDGVSEVKDIEHILRRWTKFTGKEIWMLIDWFKPYACFRRTEYKAGDEDDGKESMCCHAPIRLGICTECHEHSDATVVTEEDRRKAVAYFADPDNAYDIQRDLEAEKEDDNR